MIENIQFNILAVISTDSIKGELLVQHNVITEYLIPSLDPNNGVVLSILAVNSGAYAEIYTSFCTCSTW